MGIASRQEVPNKPEEKAEWTFKRLFPLGGAVSLVAKTFTNPFDILLGYLVLILGIAELMGRQVSWFLWVFTVLILASDVLERYTGIPLDTKKEKLKGKK
jgi:hypothetical protein